MKYIVTYSFIFALMTPTAQIVRASEKENTSNATISSEMFSQDIENFLPVSPGFFRGARPSYRGFGLLSQANFRSVISLQGGDLQRIGLDGLIGALSPDESKAAAKEEEEVIFQINKSRANAGLQPMVFVHKPMDAFLEYKEEDKQVVRELVEYIGKPENQPVYLHCSYGKDRTGLIVALYQIRFEGMSVEKAYEEMKTSGHAGYNSWFTQSLDDVLHEMAPEMAAKYKKEFPNGKAANN